MESRCAESRRSDCPLTLPLHRSTPGRGGHFVPPLRCCNKCYLVINSLKQKRPLTQGNRCIAQGFAM